MLEVQNIDRFYGRAHILHGLSFSLDKGKVAALLGRNGAGKSTTLKSIMHLLPAASGKVLLKDVDLTDLPCHRIAQLGIGYVPEDRRVFPDLTVLENLDVGRRQARGDIRPWNLERLFELFPNLEERRHHLGKEMSGGEQQMLSIARTLMGNPSLILLDEPSEGLAPVIVEQMAAAIMTLKDQGLAILLSEQNLPFARGIADRAFVIEKGTLRFDGSMAELQADSAVRDTYLAV